MWHRRAGELCPGMGYEHDAIYSEKKRRDFTNIYTAMQEYRDPYVEGTVKCTPETVNIVDLNRPSLPHPFPR